MLSVTEVLCFFLLLLVPCTPNIGSVVLDCFTNSALLDWNYSEGALNYTATARSSSGHVSTCSSNFTNCELQDLQCGQTYNVITLASNEKCSSPSSTSLEVESGELSKKAPVNYYCHKLDLYNNKYNYYQLNILIYWPVDAEIIILLQWKWKDVSSTYLYITVMCGHRCKIATSHYFLFVFPSKAIFVCWYWQHCSRRINKTKMWVKIGS